jgi:hypothetical protein
VNWINLAQGNDKWPDFINTAMKFGDPQNAGDFVTNPSIRCPCI